MAANRKRILLIVPSTIIAKGLEGVFNDLGEFELVGVMTGLSKAEETRLRNMDVDVIILDPSIFGHGERVDRRIYLSGFTQAAVVAFQSSICDEDSLRQYDGVIGLYDEPTMVIRKLRSALESRTDAPTEDKEELSAREKEILVCVAKGMLNKEIADLFNLSIYTVITHRKNITRKTGIKTVAGLTVYALLNNLIDIGSVE